MSKLAHSCDYTMAIIEANRCKEELGIKTSHVYPPIPIRSFDWSAHYGDYDLGDLIGWGPTEELAIQDLLDLTEDYKQ